MSATEANECLVRCHPCGAFRFRGCGMQGDARLGGLRPGRVSVQYIKMISKRIQMQRTLFKFRLIIHESLWCRWPRTLLTRGSGRHVSMPPRSIYYAHRKTRQWMKRKFQRGHEPRAYNKLECEEGQCECDYHNEPPHKEYPKNI